MVEHFLCGERLPRITVQFAVKSSAIEGMEEQEKWHGTPGGYTNHRCRGPKCKSAWAGYVKNRRAKIRENSK
jgi:hypothetical protein